ncbi:AglZ/HisF2 family acetamidino modification protein [Flavihumibacter petaseus]|uniref:imidazole glycerol-phosphate synthase n=1 Tax=Flavihumibacter petaseus NBRC 106054 TaxID=1220578 RepID=A0A0E9N5H2_9BACT|nr:AglZ/HisF2 family acetamidino modification protein [Flavihumibacter petaseus]GAO45217.1 imidazole glycerol phosphate synthase subunit HisF [Flavihumibacter petaseus NBRC 106054]
MKRIRIIPVLLLRNEGLYKTVGFKDARYVGDPVNTVKIFNEKGVDEIVVLDISATKTGQSINFAKIREMAGEAFMPMAYGGGVASFEDARKVFDAGFEKVIVNTAAVKKPDVITRIAQVYGSQSAVVCIDAKKNWLGKYRVYIEGGTVNTGKEPWTFAREMENIGAGEIIIQSIDRDGTWTGYDLELVKKVSEQINVPVIACGGARDMSDFRNAVTEGGASAVAAGSMFVYQKKGMGVLISFPGESLKV